MDALGAHAPEPDDEYLFNAIVADVDGDAIEQAVTTPAPDPAPVESAPPAPAGAESTTADPVPVEFPQTPPPAPAPSPDQERATAPTPTLSPVLQPELVRPRPVVVVEHEPRRIAPPTKPSASEFRQERALEWGYRMSIGVGVSGQIASFGGLIAGALPHNIKFLGYASAALGAAFAEITMVGCGAAALKRRYNEGSWKALAAIAWLVCGYATALNVFHWAPLNVGLAVMFGGGSLVGFAAHTVAKHLEARDYERQLGVYRDAVAEVEAEQRHLAEEARQEEERRRQIEQTAKKAKPSAPSRPAPSTAAKRTGGRVLKEEAVRVGVAKRASKPSELREALKAAGYTLPSSSTTLENWCREIKQQLANEAQ